MRLKIEGSASPEGSPEYNTALSERRARAVRDYLTSRGIAASRLSIPAYGEKSAPTRQPSAVPVRSPTMP